MEGEVRLPDVQRSLDDRQPSAHDYECDQDLPGRDRERIGVNVCPFQVDGSGRPGHGRAQRNQDAGWYASPRQRINQHDDAADAQDEREGARHVQPLAENGARQRRRPDRHSIGQNRHA